MINIHNNVQCTHTYRYTIWLAMVIIQDLLLAQLRFKHDLGTLIHDLLMHINSRFGDMRTLLHIPIH